MDLLRLSSLIALATACLLVPTRAEADCSAPSDCICSTDGSPSYALDVRIPEDADLSGVVEVEVIAAFGDGVDSILGENTSTFELSTGRIFSGVTIRAGDRAFLVLGPSSAPLSARRLDADGDLDCSSADALPVAEVARLALSENCHAEANKDLGPCDDMGCSVGGAPSASLLLLGLLGLTRRRRN